MLRTSYAGAAVASRPLKTMQCIVLLTRLRVQQRMGEAQNKNGCQRHPFMLGSPCWTRTNDRRWGHGRIARAGACNARCPCPFYTSLHLPQAALGSEPVNSRDTAAPQRCWPTSSRKTKTKHRVKRCFAFGSPCWTRTNDRRLGHGRIARADACNARCPCPFSASLHLPQAALGSEPVNSRMLYQCKGYKPE